MYRASAFVGDRLRRLERAAEIAAVEARKTLAREAVPEEHGLCQPLFVEGTVEMALDASLRIPSGLSVAHDDKLSGAAKAGPLARCALARALCRAHEVSSASFWRAGVLRRRSWPDTGSRGACKPGWWRCWHARAFPAPRAGPRSTAAREKRTNGAACEDARAG